MPSITHPQLKPNERDMLLCLGIRITSSQLKFASTLREDEMRIAGIVLQSLRERCRDRRTSTLYGRWKDQAEEWFGTEAVDSWMTQPLTVQ